MVCRETVLSLDGLLGRRHHWTPPPLDDAPLDDAPLDDGHRRKRLITSTILFDILMSKPLREPDLRSALFAWIARIANPPFHAAACPQNVSLPRSRPPVTIRVELWDMLRTGAA